MGIFPVSDVPSDFYDSIITLEARLPDTAGVTGGRQVSYAPPITLAAQVEPAAEPFTWTVHLAADPGPQYQVGAALTAPGLGRVGVTDRKDYSANHVVLTAQKQKATF